MLDKALEVSNIQLLIWTSGIFLGYLLVQVILDPLRDVPGPFLARFTRWWYFIEIYKGRFELKSIELHRIYGPIVRIAPQEYSVDDVDAVRIIYSHGNPFPKARWYWSWMPATSTERSLFTDEDNHHHASQRRKISSFFTMTNSVSYESFIDSSICLLTTRLIELSSLNSSFDFHHWLQCYAFDVIGHLTFGKRFGFLDMGEDKEGVFQALESKGIYSTFVGVFPWIHRYLFPLMPSSAGMNYILSFAAIQMSNREQLLKNPKVITEDGPADMMTRLLIEHERHPEKLTKVDLFTTVQANIGAGSDTIAITLTSIFYHLIKHPQTYQQLRKEIDNASKEGRISDPITFKEAQSLPYLQAVLKEGMRIHPVVGLGLQRVVPKEGAQIAGRFVTGGSTIGINPWVAHRNKIHWGHDADEWRPERWLEFEAQERTAEVERYYMPFGLGSRTCIGKNISLLEMSKVIPQLVRTFNFKLSEGVKGDGLKSLNRWFVKQQDFRAQVYLRGESAIQ